MLKNEMLEAMEFLGKEKAYEIKFKNDCNTLKIDTEKEEEKCQKSKK